MKYYQPKLGIFGLIFLIAIFIEIAGFIVVGRAIGVLPTLGLIILSMVAGCVLLRIQGVQILQKIQSVLAQGRVPDKEMLQGALMVLGAILLIIPGFVTDIIGILLFIPPVRNVIWRLVSKRVDVKTNFHAEYKDDKGKIIDLDGDDYHASDPKNSPWKKNGGDQFLP